MNTMSRLLFFFGGMFSGVGFYVMQADPKSASIMLLGAIFVLIFAFIATGE